MKKLFFYFIFFMTLINPLLQNEVNCQKINKNNSINGFGESLPCHINAACSDFDNYRNQIKGVFKYNGCTAFFINNTAQDGKPLFITAAHVYNGPGVTGEIIDATLYLDYQSQSCENPPNEPTATVINTRIKLLNISSPSSYADADRVLLEIVGEIPSHMIYLLGWDRTLDNLIGQQMVSFSHPQGDIKKGLKPTINARSNVVIDGYLYNQSGIIESGSSGSPLIDHNNRVRGHISSGKTYGCGENLQAVAYYICMYYQWEELAPYLDPLNLGSLYLDGQDYALPVELTTFTVQIKKNLIELYWQTVTEINNFGFEIQKSTNLIDWDSIGFLAGHGNSNAPKDYYYHPSNQLIDKNTYYRLKQIDSDGKSQYSKIAQVVFTVNQFQLQQNYPNPFNPTTIIAYSLANDSQVDLSVYDLLGQKMSSLISQRQGAGIYQVEFNGENLPNGIYIYRLKTDQYTQTKKMVLTK